MGNWAFEPLDRTRHDRAAFSCGNAPLDAFLHNFVGQYEKRRLGKTYVAVVPGEKQILGYYTLASGALSFEILPQKVAKKLPKHPLPVILLARLAVDRTMQGQGLGADLLVDALHRSLALSKHLGVHAVEVDAIDERAKAFYEKFGFFPLLDNSLHLYLPIAAIEDAFNG